MLSPTEQLKSRNGRYFFINVSRVDFENAILKRQFLFSGRVLGGFWYRPSIDGPYLGFGPNFSLRNKKIGFHAKNGKKNLYRIFGFELFATRYGPPLGRADTKTRPENKNLRLKILFSESVRETPIRKYPLFLDSSWTLGDSTRMKYGPKPVLQRPRNRNRAPKPEIRAVIASSGCFRDFRIAFLFII